MHSLHAVPVEASRGQEIPWDWSYMPPCVLRTKTWSSVKAVSALNGCTISPGPRGVFVRQLRRKEKSVFLLTLDISHGTLQRKKMKEEIPRFQKCNPVMRNHRPER